MSLRDSIARSFTTPQQLLDRITASASCKACGPWTRLTRFEVATYDNWYGRQIPPPGIGWYCAVCRRIYELDDLQQGTIVDTTDEWAALGLEENLCYRLSCEGSVQLDTSEHPPVGRCDACGKQYKVDLDNVRELSRIPHLDLFGKGRDYDERLKVLKKALPPAPKRPKPKKPASAGAVPISEGSRPSTPTEG